jgi:hypothetical protein
MIRRMRPNKSDHLAKARRKTEREHFRSELPVEVCAIDTDEAPAAYRIVSSDDQPSAEPYLVRRFRSCFWWPLLDAGGYVSPCNFAKGAGAGDPTVLSTLGVDVQWADKPSESPLTIPAELHRAVMELAPEHRRDRAAVNKAAARVPDPER